MKQIAERVRALLNLDTVDEIRAYAGDLDMSVDEYLERIVEECANKYPGSFQDYSCIYSRSKEIASLVARSALNQDLMILRVVNAY